MWKYSKPYINRRREIKWTLDKADLVGMVDMVDMAISVDNIDMVDNVAIVDSKEKLYMPFEPNWSPLALIGPDWPQLAQIGSKWPPNNVMNEFDIVIYRRGETGLHTTMVLTELLMEG